MLTFGQMLVRLVVATILGSVLGVERELVGKEAGVRTEILVAGGAALFTMIGLTLPYLLEGASNGAGGQSIIANIVVGIGFLGGGLIIRTDERAHGVTTAALVWATAAIGILAGLGLTEFATASTILMAVLLYALRKAGLSEKLDPHSRL